MNVIGMHGEAPPHTQEKVKGFGEAGFVPNTVELCGLVGPDVADQLLGFAVLL